MSQRTSRSLTVFIIITVAVFSLIAYLGVRTLEHEVLLRHYQSQTMAQTRAVQASDSVMDILRQKATRLDAITDYIQPNEQALKELVEKITTLMACLCCRKIGCYIPTRTAR